MSSYFCRRHYCLDTAGECPIKGAYHEKVFNLHFHFCINYFRFYIMMHKFSLNGNATGEAAIRAFDATNTIDADFDSGHEINYIMNKNKKMHMDSIADDNDGILTGRAG